MQNFVNENLTSFYKTIKQSATNPTAYVLLVFSFQKEEKKKKNVRNTPSMFKSVTFPTPTMYCTNNKIIQLCDDTIILQ